MLSLSPCVLFILWICGVSYALHVHNVAMYAKLMGNWLSGVCLCRVILYGTGTLPYLLMVPLGDHAYYPLLGSGLQHFQGIASISVFTFNITVI